MRSYSPEILEQIEKVCKDPALRIFSQHQDTITDINRITNFLISICKFLKQHSTTIGTHDYILNLNVTGKSGRYALTAARILNYLNNDSKMIEIDENLKIVSSNQFNDLSISGISNYSFNNKSVLILVKNGFELAIFIDGVASTEIDINYPLSQPRVNKHSARTSKNYRLSIIDFYNLRVRHNITNHWSDKSKRILKPGKTEDIFQDQLTNWLSENISDGLVTPKVKKLSKDETDIEIRALGGTNYLIEIKWLGTNESKTTYEEPRIKDSINQVNSYLQTDPSVLDATIVVYDGRNLEKFKKMRHVEQQKDEWKRLDGCLKKKLTIRATCYVFFLVSLSASQKKN